jgi:hypothetical protein
MLSGVASICMNIVVVAMGKTIREFFMKKGKILIIGLISLLMASSFFLAACETFDYSSSSCPRSAGCNAIIYCGKGGCAGYWGGKCNC